MLLSASLFCVICYLGSVTIADKPKSCCSNKGCTGRYADKLKSSVYEVVSGSCLKLDGAFPESGGVFFYVTGKAEVIVPNGATLNLGAHTVFGVYAGSSVILQSRSRLEVLRSSTLKLEGSVKLRLAEGAIFQNPEYSQARFQNAYIDLEAGASFTGGGYSKFNLVNSGQGFTMRLGENSTFKIGVFVNFNAVSESSLFVAAGGSVTITSHCLFSIERNAHCNVERITTESTGRSCSKSVTLKQNSKADDEKNMYKCFSNRKAALVAL